MTAGCIAEQLRALDTKFVRLSPLVPEVPLLVIEVVAVVAEMLVLGLPLAVLMALVRVRH